MIQGAILPIYGIFLPKMLFVLNHPEKLYVGQMPPLLDAMGNPLEPELFLKYDKRAESNKWCLLMFIAALASLVTSFLKRFCFGLVGEDVTYRIRKDLFKKILSQSKTWFD